MTIAKTAKFVRQLMLKDGADQALYQLSEPLEGFSHVVVSAVCVMFSGPETYIFGANENGEIEDFGELEGSFRGGLGHKQALLGAGYEIA